MLGETNKADLFKEPIMLQRLSELDNMQHEDKNHILHVLDGFIKSVKLKKNNPTNVIGEGLLT